MNDSDLEKEAETEKDEWRDAQTILDKAIALFEAALVSTSQIPAGPEARV